MWRIFHAAKNTNKAKSNPYQQNSIGYKKDKSQHQKNIIIVMLLWLAYSIEIKNIF